MLETIIEHGCYRAHVRLYSKPVDDMAGLVSINDSKMEINIKLTSDDIHNLRDMIEDWMKLPLSPH